MKSPYAKDGALDTSLTQAIDMLTELLSYPDLSVEMRVAAEQARACYRCGVKPSDWATNILCRPKS